MPHSKKEIESALEELKLSMLESLEVNALENEIKQKKIASHFRVQKAKEVVYSLELN